MHDSVMDWVGSEVNQHGLANKETLEVGSLDVNGSVRSLFRGAYVGLDVAGGASGGGGMSKRKRTSLLVCNEHGIRYEQTVNAPDWIAFACPKGDEAIGWVKRAKPSKALTVA